MMIIGYRDDQGRLLFVHDGISRGKEWGTFYRRPGGGLKRFRGLPMRALREQAEEDLRLRALRRRWRPVTAEQTGQMV